MYIFYLLAVDKGGFGLFHTLPVSAFKVFEVILWPFHSVKKSIKTLDAYKN